jgi:hypothetical protein
MNYCQIADGICGLSVWVHLDERPSDENHVIPECSPLWGRQTDAGAYLLLCTVRILSSCAAIRVSGHAPVVRNVVQILVVMCRSVNTSIGSK